MTKFFNMKNLADNSAEINIYGDIECDWWFLDGTATTFQQELNALGDVDKIFVNIKSYGGDVFEGQAIYSMLKRHKAFIHVRVDGVAASIASVIAMAGDHVEIPENAMMMIHEPWMMTMGSAKELRKEADTLDKVTETIIATYVQKVGDKLSEEEIRNKVADETWFDGKEAVAFGFADAVVDAAEISAFGNQKILAKFKNMPERLKPTANAQSEPVIQAESIADIVAAVMKEMNAQPAIPTENLANSPNDDEEKRKLFNTRKKQVLEAFTKSFK